MSTAPPSTIDENIRRQFEAAWRAGHPRSIESFLDAAAHPLYLPTLEELVVIELEFLWKGWQKASAQAGSTPVAPPLVEQYLSRFPQLGQAPVLRRLVEQEFLVRQRHGDHPSATEYNHRFPEVVSDQLTLSSTAAESTRSLPAPPQIPGLQILEELGRGGMGVVYKAHQARPGRVVALKMIGAGRLAGAEDLARFRTEVEAVARLQDPHIVQIHEVGEWEGLPYCVLEYVEGGNLARHLAGTPQPLRAAAELLETLARTIHGIHQRGIVHRDLKPANILLQKNSTTDNTDNTDKINPGSSLSVSSVLSVVELVPKIADFGLAKFWREDDAGGAGHTRTGMVLGTPSYMAPEQAAGRIREISPRTDVYALGAILYEMLTGRPPFKAESATETAFQVLREEPVAPARLRPKLPRDLETICLKCLHKEPARRYASAGELADDLRCFLDGKPIRARATPLWERSLKWARRHPAVTVLAGVGLLVLLAGILAGVWHTVQIGAALEVADQRRREADTERQRAEVYLQKARQIIQETLDWLGHEKLKYVPHMEQERPRILSKALAFSLELLREAENDPALRRQVGQDYGRLAEAYRQLGQHEEARQAYFHALRIQQALVEEFPDDPIHQIYLASTHNNLGLLWSELGEAAKAQQEVRTALKLHDALVARLPADPQRRHSRATSYNLLGTVLHRQSLPAAEQAYRAGLADWRALVKQFPGSAEYRYLLAGNLLNLANLRRILSPKHPAIDPGFREAQEILDRLVAHVPDNADYRLSLAGLHENLGLLAIDRQQWERAVEQFGLAKPQMAKLTRDFPSRPDYCQRYAGLCQRLILLLPRLQRQADVLGEYRQLLTCYRVFLSAAPDQEDVRRGLLERQVTIHTWALEGKQHHLAEQFSRLNLALDEEFRKSFGPAWNAPLQEEHRRLAEVLLRSGKYQEAATVAEQMASLTPERWQGYYQAARLLGRCLTAVRKDKLAFAERLRLSSQYAGQGLRLLEEATAKGFTDGRRLQREPDLAALRALDGYQRLSRQLNPR